MAGKNQSWREKIKYCDSNNSLFSKGKTLVFVLPNNLTDSRSRNKGCSLFTVELSFKQSSRVKQCYKGDHGRQ